MLVFHALRTRQSIIEGYFYAIPIMIAAITPMITHKHTLIISKMNAAVTFFFKVNTS